jgi:hypothetical protein
VLAVLEPRLSRRPGLNARALVAMVHSLPALVPATDEELVTFERAHEEGQRQERSRLPWWEQRDIDWDAYHRAVGRQRPSVTAAPAFDAR